MNTIFFCFFLFPIFQFFKGPSIKDVHSQRGGRFVQCRHFVDKEEGKFFKCGRSHFLVQKASDFSVKEG